MSITQTRTEVAFGTTKMQAHNVTGRNEIWKKMETKPARFEDSVSSVQRPDVVKDPVTPTTEDQSLIWKNNGILYDKGPDQILPSEATRTCYPDGAVKISQIGTGEIFARKPISVPSLLEQSARTAPNQTALAVKRNGEWKKLTYSEYIRDIRTVAKAFISLGLERHHSVCILGFNSPEWFISNFAAIYAGGIGSGIYATSSPEACHYILKHSRANVLVLEDETQYAKISGYLKTNELPHLKAVVQYIGTPSSLSSTLLSWEQLLAIGEKQDDSLLTERLKRIAINQPCTLIYTSGTCGPPKGVMLSHDNFTWNAFASSRFFGYRGQIEESISFLPLSHVAAQIGDMYVPMEGCGTVYFADKMALKGSLVDTMKEVQPTSFMAVPRLWEKMYEKLSEVDRDAKGLKKTLLTWARHQGSEYANRRLSGVEHSSAEFLQFKLARRLVFSKIHAALGLSRSRMTISGAAPIDAKILNYFHSVNLMLTELYGMSECAGTHTMDLDCKKGTHARLGSVGKTIEGAVTKIFQPDAKGNGEILLGGRHVFMGYLHQPEQTKEALDAEGFLHTGDIGRLDDDGYLFVTGRMKELLITAGGENVPPVPIESHVKCALPFVSQAVVIGDRLKFLSILLTMKTEINSDTLEPTEKLLPVTHEWMKEHGNCNCNTVSDVVRELNGNKKLIQAIQAGIDEANQKAPSRAQKIQKWVILQTDFSLPGGELGPTLKLKRHAVYEKYKSVISSLYSAADNVNTIMVAPKP